VVEDAIGLLDGGASVLRGQWGSDNLLNVVGMHVPEVYANRQQLPRASSKPWPLWPANVGPRFITSSPLTLADDVREDRRRSSEHCAGCNGGRERPIGKVSSHPNPSARANVDPRP